MNRERRFGQVALGEFGVDAGVCVQEGVRRVNSRRCGGSVLLGRCGAVLEGGLGVSQSDVCAEGTGSSLLHTSGCEREAPPVDLGSVSAGAEPGWSLWWVWGHPWWVWGHPRVGLGASPGGYADRVGSIPCWVWGHLRASPVGSGVQGMLTACPCVQRGCGCACSSALCHCEG